MHDGERRATPTSGRGRPAHGAHAPPEIEIKALDMASAMIGSTPFAGEGDGEVSFCKGKHFTPSIFGSDLDN